mmetsp:Transcript_16739/g.52018  ORF Transcript_16739/g.52018 Transcript_16739/m.52018 type:complete len:256 (-) Transcript_16739:75-842(-)
MRHVVVQVLERERDVDAPRQRVAAVVHALAHHLLGHHPVERPALAELLHQKEHAALLAAIVLVARAGDAPALEIDDVLAIAQRAQQLDLSAHVLQVVQPHAAHGPQRLNGHIARQPAAGRQQLHVAHVAELPAAQLGLESQLLPIDARPRQLLVRRDAVQQLLLRRRVALHLLEKHLHRPQRLGGRRPRGGSWRVSALESKRWPLVRRRRALAPHRVWHHRKPAQRRRGIAGGLRVVTRRCGGLIIHARALIAAG